MPDFDNLKIWSFRSFIADRFFFLRNETASNSSCCVPCALNMSLLVIFFSSWITCCELGDLTNVARVSAFFILFVRCTGWFDPLVFTAPLILFSIISSSNFHFSSACEILFCIVLNYFLLWFLFPLGICLPLEVKLLIMLAILSFLRMPRGEARLFLVVDSAATDSALGSYCTLGSASPMASIRSFASNSSCLICMVELALFAAGRFLSYLLSIYSTTVGDLLAWFTSSVYLLWWSRSVWRPDFNG